MKHGLALVAAGLVLLVGAVLVAHPPMGLMASAGTCLSQAASNTISSCRLAPTGSLLGLVDGVPDMALIFFIGALASFGGGIVALRVYGR